MKALLIGMLIFSFGWGGRVALEEYANLRNVRSYNRCLAAADPNSSVSVYNQCNAMLEYRNKLEEIILFTPNLWEPCLGRYRVIKFCN